SVHRRLAFPLKIDFWIDSREAVAREIIVVVVRREQPLRTSETAGVPLVLSVKARGVEAVLRHDGLRHGRGAPRQLRARRAIEVEVFQREFSALSRIQTHYDIRLIESAAIP